MERQIRFLLLVVALFCLPALAACDSPEAQGSANSVASPTGAVVSPTAVAPIEVPATPTETPVPPVPTNTVAPTDTPAPAFTATLVPTPSQTATDTPTVAPDTATPTRRVSPTRKSTATSTPRRVPSRTSTPVATATPEVENTPAPTPTRTGQVNGYDAYIPAATKKHQYYHYSCEFDAAWVVLKTFGFDVSLDEQVAVIGLDTSIEPRWEETTEGIFIYGGDITNYYSGDYRNNFLARSSGSAMSKVFQHFGLRVTPVHNREGIQSALLSGSLVWVKVPVDFNKWRPATWVMPDGRTYQTVLGNDHAVVVMGFNRDVVVIRDVLGPTSTNWARKYEYELTWDRFLTAWGAQSYDGLAVGLP